MKTAISLPDETFERATQRAAELGMSRSEFFARAAEQYLRHLDDASLTAQIDAILDRTGDDDSASAAVAAGRGTLAATTWDEPDW
ncbi:CopG family transcriptional regulator [Jiangella mangrovi]|uniref:Putative DNA-binding protein n=1 Tax=Jiangella mangrovi TaxID=1524084 RepID=A0A7W9GU46_9ACTN|nr:CopG family transcriptional regulator [Jiangella mangrovi]MBB5790054.1 putative DNA-binding protein [Jiangella mangrovi]